MEMLPPGAHMNAKDYALTSNRGGRITRLRTYTEGDIMGRYAPRKDVSRLIIIGCA